MYSHDRLEAHGLFFGRCGHCLPDTLGVGGGVVDSRYLVAGRFSVLKHFEKFDVMFDVMLKRTRLFNPLYALTNRPHGLSGDSVGLQEDLRPVGSL